MTSDIIHIGIITEGKEICVNVEFSVDQDVNDAFIKLTVPSGVEHSKSILPRGTYDPITNIWNIGFVSGSESTLSGQVCFEVTNPVKTEFEFIIEGDVESACEGFVKGGTKTVTYQGTTCTEVNSCVTPMFFVGQVMTFAGNYIPEGWLACDGSILNINQYPDLFEVIGDTYGGNGTTTFALPDMRGHTVVGVGQSPGLTERVLGDTGGEEGGNNNNQ
jgi:hypothetical protein